jgi:PAS domain S-box-containing protein
MTPLRLSHQWHRRLYVALFMSSVLLVAMYVLGYFNVVTIPESLAVGLIPAIIAGFAAIACIVFFSIEKKLSGYSYSFVAYLLLTLAVSWQVLQTGGITSPYLLVWSLLSLFAAVFGAYGWIVITVLVSSFVASLYLREGLTFETLMIVAIASMLPLIIGIIVWREQGEIDDSTRNVKNLANQLSEIASKSEIVINAIGDGVIAIDATATIELINPAAQVILGWGKQDALKLSYKSIFKLEDESGKELDPAVDPVQQVLNTNQQARASHLNALTNSGKKISVSVVVNPIGDPGSGAIIVFRDITNERAEEREQAEFISTASHEMRTPVAAIEGYLGLAISPNTATIDARAKDFIIKAHEAAQHLGRLFQDLLDVSKTDDGRMTNNPRVVDVGQLTETIVQGLTEKAEKKGLRLVFSAASTAVTNSTQKKIMPVYYINQDTDHVREILDNLIDNAIKYTLTGEVVVDIQGDENTVTMSVKDSGLGIPAEDIPHLFQKFYRVSNMDRQEIGGTGLGLYLVRRLTENMQGRIWVESEYQKGSTFFLQLPRIDTQEAEHLKAAQENSMQQQVRAAQALAPAPVATELPVASLAQPNAPALAPQPATPSVQIPVQPAMQQPQIQPLPQPQMQPTSAPTRTATAVPRGESLTRDQINERVRQLEALSQQQRTQNSRER